MTRWEQLEEWLVEKYENGGRVGTNREIAAGLEVSPADASEYIRAYLNAQRSAECNTLFVLRRSGGRTTNAVWYAGIRTADARAIGHMYHSDVRQKFLRAVAPDLRRIAKRNPRAAKHCLVLIDAVVSGALTVLQAAVNLPSDEEQ